MVRHIDAAAGIAVLEPRAADVFVLLDHHEVNSACFHRCAATMPDMPAPTITTSAGLDRRCPCATRGQEVVAASDSSSNSKRPEVLVGRRSPIANVIICRSASVSATGAAHRGEIAQIFSVPRPPPPATRAVPSTSRPEDHTADRRGAEMIAQQREISGRLGGAAGGGEKGIAHRPEVRSIVSSSVPARSLTVKFAIVRLGLLHGARRKYGSDPSNCSRRRSGTPALRKRGRELGSACRPRRPGCDLELDALALRGLQRAVGLERRAVHEQIPSRGHDR